MQLDWKQLNQGGQLDRVLSTLPYPLDKDEVLAKAQQAGTNPQVLNAIRHVLPDETFNSAEDIKQCLPRQ